MTHLPSTPNLDHLRRQAKDLLKELRAGTPDASARFRDHHPQPPDTANAQLSDAQLVLAREYGFASWPRLKQHVEQLTEVQGRVDRLRAEFAAGDRETKRRLLKPAHAQNRFENYDPDAASISEADARLLVANAEGYAFWNKYESYLYLDPAVQAVISAVRVGDLAKLRTLLQDDPAAASPRWVPGFAAPPQIPNDSIPLFCISEGIFRGTNQESNGYELARALLAAGAVADCEEGLPLISAVSFGAIGVVEALLDAGAAVDGVDGDGVPMGYAMLFAFTEIAELLSARGAKLDLRFAAGLGRLDLVKEWFAADGSLKPGAGALADPYGFEWKRSGESPIRCERTRPNILSQALCFACVHGRLETAAFLLEQGAAINAIVPGLDTRATVLHLLAGMDERRLAVVRFLLDHGADPAIRDQQYHATALNWARFHKRETTMALLQSYEEGNSAG